MSRFCTRLDGYVQQTVPGHWLQDTNGLQGTPRMAISIRATLEGMVYFSLLLASVSAGPANTVGIGPSPASGLSIINRCGVDGALDHEFVVTLKPPPSSSRRRAQSLKSPPSSSRAQRLSFLQGWVHQYDSSNGTSSRRKLEANSNSTHVLHFFTETQLAVAVSTSDDVRGIYSTRQ